MLTLCLNLEGIQHSQFANYNFNSMARIGKTYVGANENGIYEIDTGGSDDGTPIEAFFELPTSDWGISFQKRLRSAYAGYETDGGDLAITFRNDEGHERTFLLTANHTGNLQHGTKVFGARDMKGRYWMVRVDNINGADFSIDHIEVVPVILGRKPSGA